MITEEQIMVDQMQPSMAMPEISQPYFEAEPVGPLDKFIESLNIAKDLKEDQLKKIGSRCLEGYQVDEKSREGWLKKNKDAMDLANQVLTEKSFPWRNAANIKLPLITDAAIKFAARAYSEIIRDGKVVKGSIIGADPDGSKQERAERVGDYMSWQLMDRESEWETDTDKLLHVLPIVGHLFRKRYWCSAEKRTKSEICMPNKVVVNNQAANMVSARRVTHVIDNVPTNDVITNQRSGVWLEVDLKPDGKEPTIERDSLADDDYYVFLEQHCWLDLDGDGYEEPYTVTFEKESSKVVRILANYNAKGVHVNDAGQIMRIEPVQCFTDYIFMPALDGSYYGMGFGQIMLPLNTVANTIVNQLLDSGTLNNVNGGYLSKEIKLLSGVATFQPNEWKKTSATAEQLSRGVFPLPTKEPSPTLFNLLGLVMDLCKDLASVKDVLGGDSPGMNVPATTVMALIEQGMKTFNAIYKRIYRSLKREYKQLYDINFEYLDDQEYYTVLDEQRVVAKSDFEPDSIDVIPIADPNMSSDMQRLARAEALKGAIGLPGVDPKPIIRKWMEAMRITDNEIDEILPEQDPNGVPPHIQKMMHDVEMKQADVQNRERELDLKEREFEVNAMVSISTAIKNFADAEAKEAGQQLNSYQAIANNILQKMQIESKAKESQQQPEGNNAIQNQIGGLGAVG